MKSYDYDATVLVCCPWRHKRLILFTKRKLDLVETSSKLLYLVAEQPLLAATDAAEQRDLKE